MSKFKIGDKVVVIDASGGTCYKVGEECIVVGMYKGIEGTIINCKDKFEGMYDFRFKLAEEKKFDIKDIIKPLMRVITRSKRVWIAVEDENRGIILIDPVLMSWNRVRNPCESIYPEYDIIEVYDKPDAPGSYLNPDKLGPLIWKQKTEKELKIEALEKEAATINKLLAELKASD